MGQIREGFAAAGAAVAADEAGEREAAVTHYATAVLVLHSRSQSLR